MNYHFLAHRQVRENLQEILRKTSLEELTMIPDGFNNNIFWNIAHCVATQQLLHYYLSGNEFVIDTVWIENYKKGTLPNLDISQEDVQNLDFILIETSKVLVKNYDEGIFSDYRPYSTSFGLDLKKIQDAIIFNNMHESLHYGYVMAQKRAILGEKY
ncbi:DinB family protein [Bergeyella cardium]|uniref:DinB family protein n=1 Tax=Bergeyella cardium TaxID=1585976 RepID=A0A6P1QV42_9FLAO|nr:DinB family protein [Bergeyella cardium]QHN65408.1 DinB family protein [Bergeyella cardium]WHE32986.1 DinB family protein [Bergeyella cardium]WHF59638.1 DinB family protein [Bergeyella cardium]